MSKDTKEVKLVVSWNIRDIGDIKPNWSDETCEIVLLEISKSFEEMLGEKGNEILENLLDRYSNDELGSKLRDEG
jgi:hypothetical protein